MRLFRSWLILLLVCVLWSMPAAAGATDPRVDRARADLDAARAAEAATSAELDRAAEAFEAARAHAERLDAESATTGRTVATARSVATEADDVLRRRLMLLYAHPELRAQVLSPSALGDNMAETLHRFELIGRLARTGVEDRRRADRALTRVESAEQDHRVVTAGVRDAIRRRRDRAAALGTALDAAQRRVGVAEQGVQRAQAVVEAEHEERRRQRARRRAEQQRLRSLEGASSGTAPLPPVDGKVCPLAAPNAFSDTWGAPRSGGRSHQGVDMFAAYGAPLYAVTSGTVRLSNSALGGLSIHLTGDDGDRYYYAHLSDTFVGSGQRVVAGQHIGANGNSGNARSTPPHLHWQYHPGGGAAVNPYPLAFALCRT